MKTIQTILFLMIANAAFSQEYLFEYKNAEAINQNIIKLKLIEILTEDKILLKSASIYSMGTDKNKVPIIVIRITGGKIKDITKISSKIKVIQNYDVIINEIKSAQQGVAPEPASNANKKDMHDGPAR